PLARSRLASYCEQREKESLDKVSEPTNKTSSAPMTIRGGGHPKQTMVLAPVSRMGPPPRSFPPMRMDASWSGRYGPTGYKVAARVPRARQRAPLGRVIPTTTSVPPCSGLSRRGLETIERKASAE